MQGAVKIENMIKESINELREEYQSNEKGFLTEADCVAKLFSILSQKFKETNVTWFLHLEMRPYIRIDRKIRVIGSEGWIEQKRANEGYRVDLAVVNCDLKSFEDAIKKAKEDQSSEELKYWRILSYPVEAFLAAIEIKVRVQGNTNIYKDIVKLEALREKNPNCLTYLVILDRRAFLKDLEEIHAYANRKNVIAILSGKQESPGGFHGNSP